MGYYIQGPHHGKAEALIENHGATIIQESEAKAAYEEGFGVVVVVDNGPFEAAGFAYSEDELKVFLMPDNRPKKWLVMDREKAEELSGFND